MFLGMVGTPKDEVTRYHDMHICYKIDMLCFALVKTHAPPLLLLDSAHAANGDYEASSAINWHAISRK